jgi:hypothetical protein
VKSTGIKEIAEELSRLFEQQIEFLETQKLGNLAAADIHAYQDRNQRIAELTNLLAGFTKPS